MPPTPQWTRAHAKLSADITKAARKARLPFRNLTDLVNTSARYPQLLPVLVEWVRDTERKSGLVDPDELHQFRDGLYRALTTIDAMGTDVVPLLFDDLYRRPPARPTQLATIGNALKYVAVPSDYFRMRAVAADRSLSFGRAPVLEWLLRADPDDALPLAVAELDDPSVRPYILRSVRVIRRLPAELRPTFERHLNDEDDEVRLQAKRTLAHMDKWSER